MSTAGGPRLEGIGRNRNSGIMMCVDAHDAGSYPGEPTTNYFIHAANGYYTGWWGDGGNQSEFTKSASNVYDRSLQYNGYPTVLWAPGTSRNCYLNGAGDIPDTEVSTEWTFSCYMKYEDGAAITSMSVYLYFSGSDGSAAGTIVDAGNGWYRVSRSRTGSSDHISLAGFTGIAAGKKIYLSGPQLEKKLYPTPFVTGFTNSGEVYDSRPASVDLMIHGNVGSGANFLDSSPRKQTITALHGVTHSDAQTKFSGGSIYFDGSGDALRLAPNEAVAFGTADWTVDFWHYRLATVSWSTFLDTYSDSSGTNDGFIIGYYSTNNQLAFYTENTGTWHYYGSSTVLAQDTWYHIAYVRSGNTLKIYLNGQEDASFTFSASDTFSAQYLYIGSRSIAQYINGYMDEVRITRGTALWTSAFTPPTTRSSNAPVVDLSGNDGGGNFNTTDMTDVATYRDGQVIEPVTSATWDFDGTDDRIECSFEPNTGSFDLKCFELAIQQYQAVTPDGGMGGWYSNVGFTLNDYTGSSGNDLKNGLNIGSWTGGMTDETVSWWGYGTGGYWATYIKDTIPAGWHIYTINWNGSSYDIWIDGAKKTTYFMTSHAALFQGVVKVSLGWNQGWNYYFKGKMGCVRCYDTSLTDQQIKQNFNTQRSRFRV